MFLCGLSGIDLALWDLLGKRRSVPVTELLGGAVHDRLPAYASLPPYHDLERVLAESKRAAEAGYRGVKLHELEPSTAAAAVDAVGPDVAVMVDVNGHFTAEEAIDVAAELAEAGVLWFEEPTWPMRDVDALTRVADASTIKLAAGENEWSLADFERLLAANAISYVQPEITKIGGLSAALRIGTLAELHNVALCPHNFRCGPSLAASITWAMVNPRTAWIEVPWVPTEVAFPSGWSMPRLTDGYIEPAAVAGFGP